MEKIDDFGDEIWYNRQKLISAITREVGKLSWERRPLNIIFIGTAGCGKSSAINTITAAFADDYWREYALSGKGGSSANQMTYRLRRFPAEKYCTSEKLTAYAMPTLIDLAGLQNEDSDLNTEIIRIILFGELRPGESPQEAYMYGSSNGIDKMRLKYCANNEVTETKVDRIVFVASCMENIPVHLINCVTRAARPSIGPARREIPIFGLLTKKDQIDESSKDFKERKQQFIESLSLEGATHRFASCVNYCDAVDPEVTRTEQIMPDIDVPMLRFMKVICGGNFEIPNDDETLDEATQRSASNRVGMTCKCALLAVVVVLMAKVIMIFFQKISHDQRYDQRYGRHYHYHY